jgi:hypothetical protein
MLEEVQSYWQELTPEAQSWVQTGGWLFVVLLGGHFLGSIVTRWLHNKNFDLALRLPGGAPAEHGITPTFFAGMLVRLSVWAGAAWWLLQRNGRTELAGTVGQVISRAWAVAAMLVFVLALGSMLARRLIECFEGTKSADPHLRNGSGAHQRGHVGGAVGACAYFLVLLLALLMSADMFGWPLTRESAQALWQLAQKLFVAGAALAIAYLGASWARDLATADGAATPEKRAGQYTAIAIIAATTVLAVGMMLSSTGVLVGLTSLVVLGLALYLVRGYLPDVAAGLQLRANKIREVWFDGTPWELAEIGFLNSHVSRAGEIHKVQNRRVLEARFRGAPVEAAAR